MGQKSNPNSFIIKKKTVTFGASSYAGEYSKLFKEQVSVTSNFVFLFEKNRCFVKNCFFIQNNEKAFTTLFISFLVWKKRKTIKTAVLKDTKKIFDRQFTNNLFLVLSKFGHISSKRLILQNLNKVVSHYQKNDFLYEHTEITKKLQLYKTEPYFHSGVMLFCLMNTTKDTSLLFSKFIAKFFKVFHRTRKINKFLRFLTEFIENTGSEKLKNTRIKGLKVSIKGRFSGAPRSKIRVFERGQIPLQTFKHEISYALTHSHTSYGVFGIKVWIFE